MPGEGLTYGQVSGGAIREDVLDIIFQITPEDTPFYNMIGDSTASNPLHQWPIRGLTVRADNAQQEGEDFLANMQNAILPSRVENLTQIVRKLPEVSESFQASNSVGISDLMADQISQRSVEWKTDVEHVLLRGSTNSGSSNDNTARRMNGYFHAIAQDGTNSYDYGSTESLTETGFNDLLQDIWTHGGKAQDVLVGGALKRVISAFTDSSTKFFMADDRRVVNTIGVYESDFHTTQIHLSRDIRSATGDFDLYAFDRSFLSKAWLRTPTVERLPKTADAQGAVIIGELTFEYGNDLAAAKHTDYQLATIPA